MQEAAHIEALAAAAGRDAAEEVVAALIAAVRSADEAAGLIAERPGSSSREAAKRRVCSRSR